MNNYDPYGLGGFMYSSNSLPNGRAIVMIMYTDSEGFDNSYWWKLYPDFCWYNF